MAEYLPDADWLDRPDLAALVTVLGAGNARFVGGAVRDTLLGLPVKDVDMATLLEPDDVMARLDAAGIRAVPTGLAHGTVTAIIASGPVEITTLRHDVSTDGRRATIAFANDWRDDAARRDFTINALYADPGTRSLSDWFGGLADLRERRVRFIGDPHERIREDHLRILRYFRFQARFGSQPADRDAETACRDLAPMLKGLSRERVAMEILNLLSLPDPSATVRRMVELGVWQQILPESDAEPLASLIAGEAAAAIAPDPMRRLAALLPADAEVANHVAAKLRLSAVQRKRLVLAAGREREGTDNPRALAYRFGREAALDRLLLTGTSVSPLCGWEIPGFPLKGGEVVAMGIKAGPEVARTLQAVESAWIASGFDNSQIAALLAAEMKAHP